MVLQRSLMLPLLFFTASITALKVAHVPSPHPFSINVRPGQFPRSLEARQTSESCDSGGTCADCFGTGYIQCASDPYSCYDPSDPSTYCPGDVTSDSCYGTFATCESCFGPGYIDCPNDDTNCYDPNNSTTFCPGDTTGGGGSGGGFSSSASGGLPIFGTSTSLSTPLGTSTRISTTSSVAVITSTSSSVAVNTSSSSMSTSTAASSTAAGTTTTSSATVSGQTTVPNAGFQAIGDVWWTGIVGGLFGGVLLNGL